MRPYEQSQNDIFITGNLKFDAVNRVVCIDDQEVQLTPIQYRLLMVLVKFLV